MVFNEIHLSVYCCYSLSLLLSKKETNSTKKISSTKRERKAIHVKAEMLSIKTLKLDIPVFSSVPSSDDKYLYATSVDLESDDEIKIRYPIAQLLLE